MVTQADVPMKNRLCFLLILLSLASRAQSPSVIRLALNATGLTQEKGYACCKFSANKRPSWESVLSLPDERSESECDWSYSEQRLAYTSPQTIVAGFHLDCLQRHGPIPPVRMHTLDLILQIDAQSGKMMKQMEWRDVSIRRNWAGDLRILPAQNGRFLVLVGSSLKLFSPEFSELKSRPLTQDKIVL